VRCSSYRYLHEGITVPAAHAPDLHTVPERARTEGWSHLDLDGTLIETDRIRAKNDKGHDARYSGNCATNTVETYRSCVTPRDSVVVTV
jgi:hypothetical protein